MHDDGKHLLDFAALVLFIIFLIIVGKFNACAEPVEGYVEIGIGPEVYGNVYTPIYVSADQSDYNALRRVIFWEAVRADCGYENGKYVLADPKVYKTCPYELYLATCETVLNRCLSKKYPDKISDVVYKTGFVHKELPKLSSEVDELIDDVISDVFDSGLRVLPRVSYVYFATKKQSCAKNHILIGTYAGHRMYFGEEK